MAAATLKIFIGQSVTTQYADLKSAGVLKSKDDQNYRDKSEVYTFLTATMIVLKKSGKPVQILIDCTKVPPMV